MKPRRVLALVGLGLTPPDSLTGKTDEQVAEFKMEYDVVNALRRLGHEVHVLESGYELHKIREAIDEFKPHIAFNMLEDFHGHAVFDQNVVSYLELLKVPYTGCNPRGLMLAKDKALTKKILTYHRIRVPRFAVFARGRRIRARRNLKYPVIVKSLVEESSTGISQASIVKDDEQLKKRVEFVHDQIGSDAVAEEYIEGRELYVAILGNRRLQTFPIWELGHGLREAIAALGETQVDAVGRAWLEACGDSRPDADLYEVCLLLGDLRAALVERDRDSDELFVLLEERAL